MKKYIYTVLYADGRQDIEDKIAAFVAERNARLAAFSATAAFHQPVVHDKMYFYAVMEEETVVPG